MIVLTLTPAPSSHSPSSRSRMSQSKLSRPPGKGYSGSLHRFEVQPQQVILGDLKEGCIYRVRISLNNTGAETGRFRASRRRKTPGKSGVPAEPGFDSPTHQLRLVYKPGPVAAGMKCSAELEVLARGPCPIDDFIEIVTENQSITIPVYGRVVGAKKHDPRRMGKRVQLFAVLPPPK